MSYNLTIRTLAWVGFWLLLFLIGTTDWNRLLQDWRRYHHDQTTIASYGDWG
jgi:hypothetical protein